MFTAVLLFDEVPAASRGLYSSTRRLRAVLCMYVKQRCCPHITLSGILMIIWILILHPNVPFNFVQSGMFKHAVILGSCHVVRSCADCFLLLFYCSMWSILPRMACALLLFDVFPAASRGLCSSTVRRVPCCLAWLVLFGQTSACIPFRYVQRRCRPHTPLSRNVRIIWMLTPYQNGLYICGQSGTL